ncbi:alpha-1,2-fucosyltransferase [Candidatus Pelagibacter sp.]|jgi:hypothetical protein|nr:alpha-1,2-fucosyltransferase [Candidatus Pelagibacter sp.]|tara:strand:+ start:399 stop:1295 length:897 start_codon:yes stop_codon:yes gene_type:complete
MKKKIYLYMCGGLGNQLFQYATAKNLALQNNRELYVDYITGFWTDFRDFRKFELNKKKLIQCKLKFIVIIYIIYRLFNKFFKYKKLIKNFFGYTIIDETNLNYFKKELKNLNSLNDVYLIGYFQSEKYFIENKENILKELKPITPKKKIFKLMKNKMITSNSVSLCIRMYEGMSGKNRYKMGGLSTNEFYKKSINKILKKIKNPEFFIFSSKKENLTNILKNFPILKKYKINLITSDAGFSNAYDNIWLLSYCKNHIISNSTLYWWGAYFSTINYKNKIICCANNFHNIDTCLNDWKT